MTVSEALLQITELTKQNMSILEILNDSFYTKKNHLTTTIGDTTYTIPSYISLENKVNHLQDAFNNLVHSAECGEAWFNFDGNSREIITRGYQSAPNPLVLSPTKFFEVEGNAMFKDMVSPRPYINVDLKGLSDDITKVNVKKIVPYNKDLLNSLRVKVGDTPETPIETVSLDWSEIVASLESKLNGGSYKKNEDYLEYETIYDLPVRTCVKSGEYVIEKVLESKINENLEEVIRVKISRYTPLTTTSFDGITIEDLSAGDILTTYNGAAKVQIESIKPAARELTLRVLSGEYVNPIGAGDFEIPEGQNIFNIVSDYSKLKYFSQPNEQRYLHIPLEEDQYVYIAVAPVNSRLNVQSSWSNGLFICTDNLSVMIDDDKVSFRTYYNENVQNIGDTLSELTNIIFPSISKFTQEEFNQMLGAPKLSEETLGVFQINKHLNDSETVKTIRNLYSQKKQAQADLNEVMGQISALQSDLAQISFDDTSGVRSAYENQLADLRNQQNSIDANIIKLTDTIQRSALDSTIPLENGKFRIRGYIDVENFVTQFAEWHKDQYTTNLEKLRSSNIRTMLNNIIGTQTRYRYRTPDVPQANIQTVGDDFVFTEWCIYEPPIRERSMKYKDGGYVVSFQDIKDDKLISSDNRNKFNQIDIPITQGEVVEIQSRIVWGFGYPFVTVATEWSDVVEVKFPDELSTDVQITTIIEENNDDIEANRFSNILKEQGVTSHVNDKIQDQDIVYYHKPENISSGFYTDERRIIPLSDKLKDINDQIVIIQDTLAGTTSETLKVEMEIDGVSNELLPDITNHIQLPAFTSIKDISKNIPTGTTYRKNDVAYMTGVISISNPTPHSLKIFSMFPGSRSISVQNLKHVKFDKADFGYEYKSANTGTVNAVQKYSTLIAPVAVTSPGFNPNDSTFLSMLNEAGLGSSYLYNKEEMDANKNDETSSVNDLSNLSFESSSIEVPQGSKVELKAFCKPVAYNNYNGITVSTDDLSVCGVSKGEVPTSNGYTPIEISGYEAGSTTQIKVSSTGSTTGEKLTATCEVKVVQPDGLHTSGTINDQPSLKISPEVIYLKPGSSMQFTPELKGTYQSGTYYPFRWSVYKSVDLGGNYKSNITSVDALGKVDANNEGYSIVECSLDNGALSTRAVVVVMNDLGDGVIQKPSSPGYQDCGCNSDSNYRDIMLVTPSGSEEDETNPIVHPQSGNQIITYRSTNPYDSRRYSDDNGNQFEFDEFISTHDPETGERLSDSVDAGKVYVFPIAVNQYSMCMNSDATVASTVLAPGQSVQFPIGIEYSLSNIKTTANFKLGFNVRNSLYSDPLYYEINLIARYNESMADLLNAAKQSLKTLSTYKTTIR